MKYIFKNVKYKGGEIHQRLPLHGAGGSLAQSSHVFNARDNQVNFLFLSRNIIIRTISNHQGIFCCISCHV